MTTRPAPTRRWTTRVAVPLLLTLLVAGSAGCSGGDEVLEALAEQAGADDLEIGADEGTPPSIPAGQEPAEADDEAVPDELPDEFPLPAGMELLDTSVDEVDGGTRVQLEATYDGDADRAVLFFDTELPAAGWTVVTNDESTSDVLQYGRWEVEGFGWTGSVEVREIVDEDDSATTTIVAVDLRTAG